MKHTHKGGITGRATVRTMIYTDFAPVDSEWTHLGDGTIFLDQGQSAKVAVCRLNGLKVGDVLTAFRIVGAVGATTANTTTVDADLRKVTKGTGIVTDASVGAITQVSKTADYSMDDEKDLTDETVADDYAYYVKITGTTADNAANDIFVTAIEVDVMRLT